MFWTAVYFFALSLVGLAADEPEAAGFLLVFAFVFASAGVAVAVADWLVDGWDD